MKITKKIIKTIFVLLPVITLIFNITFYFKSADGTNYPFAKDGYLIAESAQSSDRVVVRVKENSIAEKCFFDIFGYKNYIGLTPSIDQSTGQSFNYSSWSFSPGIANAFLRFLMILNDDAGIPISTSTIIVCFYICYLITIEILMMLYEITIFIPRKCKEIFERG